LYDVTPPKLYGLPLPLTDEVIIGEELLFVFTEPLLCSKPYSFDVQMKVFGNPTVVYNTSELQLICRENQIGVQLNQEKVQNLADLLGKQFSVELGTIGTGSVGALQDLNGNALENNVIMKKTFANLDLSQASTSFDIAIDNVTCLDKTLDVLKTEVRTKIGIVLNITTGDRIQIVDLNCVDGRNRISATVQLSPAKVSGRLLKNVNNKNENTLDLFYILRDSSASNNVKSRQLYTKFHGPNDITFFGNMKMEFGAADIVRLKRNETILSKEHEIRSYAEKYNRAVLVPEQKRNESMGLLLEKINEMHKQDIELHLEDQRKMQLIQENAQALHEEDQLKIQLLHDEDQRKMQLMQENAQALHEEDQLKMQHMQENSQALHEEEKRLLLQEVLNLRQQGDLNNERMKEEMKRVVVEMSIIMMCCMIFAVAVLYRLRL
jgi:hypothetical protein